MILSSRISRFFVDIGLASFHLLACNTLTAQGPLLTALKDPVLFKGNETTAYRDPAVLFQKGKLFLFFTLTKIEAGGKVYMYTAMSTTKNLQQWSKIKILTPRDQSLDFSSPGNTIRYKDEWIMCLQTYPRPGFSIAEKLRYGNKDSRLYIMRSKDLENWTAPELIKVKGPGTPVDSMGRMIDPYLLEDKDKKAKWWCFYKQNGVSMSFTYDFKTWQFAGHISSGENTCVLVENNEYILFHSPKNGIAVKRSSDLIHWTDMNALTTLGQDKWNWAKGRITAGAAMNLKKEKNFAAYIMVFHGSGPLTEEEGDFDKNASIGIAWSNDLLNWSWPGK